MTTSWVDRATGRVFTTLALSGPRGTCEGKFLVDTGCPVTSCDPDMIDLAGYSVRDARRLSRLIGPGDGRIVGYQIPIIGFVALGKESGPFEIHVHDMPREDGIDGLLGMDFLLRHVFIVDGPAGTVELR